MPDHARAKKHAKLAVQALDRMDSKTAAHHFGHAMSALRLNASTGITNPRTVPRPPAVAPVQEGDEPDAPPVAPQSALRGILSRLKKAPTGAP